MRSITRSIRRLRMRWLKRRTLMWVLPSTYPRNRLLHSIYSLYITVHPWVFCFLLKIWIPFALVINLNMPMLVVWGIFYDHYISIFICRGSDFFEPLFLKPRSSIFCTVDSCSNLWLFFCLLDSLTYIKKALSFAGFLCRFSYFLSDSFSLFWHHAYKKN